MSTLDNHGRKVEKIRKSFIRSNTCNYFYIQLWIKDKPTTMAIHRLVAKAFIDNPENKKTVNHIDGNKLNNNVCNLEWATYSENLKHAYTVGLKQLPTGKPGVKNGVTSKYNNVTYDKSRNRWIG